MKICPKCNRGKIELNEYNEWICEVCGIVTIQTSLEGGENDKRKM